MAIGIGIELAPSGIRAVVVRRLSFGTATSSPANRKRPGASARDVSRSADPIRTVGMRVAKVLASQEVACDTSNPEALTRALTQLRSQLRIRQPVVLGVPSSWALLTTVKPLVASWRRASIAVQFELQQYLPFDLKDAVWHFRWLPPGANGHPAEQPIGLLRGADQRLRAVPSVVSDALVIAMRRSMIADRLSTCQRAGVTVNAVTVNAVAALNVCAIAASGSGAAIPEATALLNILDQTSAEWVVFGPGLFQVVSVVGDSPEGLARELATSWGSLAGQGITLPRAVRLVGSPIAGAGVEEVVTRQLGLRVEPTDVSSLTATGLDAPQRWWTAFGLALQGVGVAPVSLNLLTMFWGEARAQRTRSAGMLLSGVCAAATVIFGLRGMMEIRQRRVGVLQALEARERLYQTLRPDVRTLLQQQERMQERSQQLERLVSDSSVLTALCTQVVEVLPETLWLVKVEWTRGEGVLDGQIEGRARSFQDVTQFLERLKTVAGMTNVKLVSNTVIPDEASSKEVIAFTVQLQRALPAGHDGEVTR